MLGVNKNSRRLLAATNLLTLFAILNLITSQALAVFTGTVPYFKVTGGDIASGGWFQDNATWGTDCQGSGFYQSPDWTNNSTFNNTFKEGGILSFADIINGQRLGSSGDYAAYSLGLVERNSAKSYGFLTGNAGLHRLTYANYWSLGTNPPAPPGFSGGGGLFEGNAGHFPQHCIPDYYGTLNPTAPSVPNPQSINLDSTFPSVCPGQCQDDVYPGTTTIGSNTGTFQVGQGSNYSLYVHGDVYITTDIVYQAHDAAHIPRFALVVKGGNIYVDKNVHRLDGIYVAQPLTAADTANSRDQTNTGQFWTCHNGSANAYDLPGLQANCLSQITFNGSVMAAQVFLTRLGGGITGSFLGPVDNGPAEKFNYSADVPLGGSFGSTSSSNPNGSIDSLIELPPVF